MGSSTVKAQKLANAANIQMSQETNQVNKDIADAANQLNYQMFNEQNQWNLDQWNRENEYNSPSAQMQRLIQAGINPMFAVGQISAGEAQQLTSADAKSAEVAKMVAPQVMPEADPSKLSNIVAATNNLSNSIQGFVKLGLESQDVNTRREAMQHAAGVQAAEALYKRSQTAGQEIFNNLNTRTFETQVSSKVAELNRLEVSIENSKKEGQLFDAELKNKNATYDQIKAMTNYTSVQANALLEQIKQGWKKLAIEQQNANTSEFSAGSSDYYRSAELNQRKSEFLFSQEKFKAELSQMSNEQILSWMKESRGVAEKWLGFTDNPFDNGNIKILEGLQAAGQELQDRLEKSPSSENVQSYQEFLNTVNSLPVAPSLPSPQTLQGYSVLNPSE